jgi:hypothetical protein
VNREAVRPIAKLAKKFINAADSAGDVAKSANRVAKNADATKAAAKADGVVPAKGPPPQYTAKSHEHVWPRHHDPSQWTKKSKFAPGEGGQKFADEVYNHPNVVVKRQQDGRWQYVVDDMGRFTGSRSNYPSRSGTLITGPDGVVITQYPGVPKGWKP